jgi:hypothetical protein
MPLLSIVTKPVSYSRKEMHRVPENTNSITMNGTKEPTIFYLQTFDSV